MQLGINLAGLDFYTGIELLPAADYPVTIESATPEKASNPASGLLKIVFVVNPEHPNAGRKLFYRLNLWNISEDSKATAAKQLKTLCFAVGITGVLNTETELIGRQCIVTVSNDGTYNNVKLVKDMQGNEPGKAPVSAGFGGQQGMPAFGAPTGGFAAPPGAMPAGFNPNQQPQSQPPPQQQQQYQQPVQQPQQPFQQAPPQGNPFDQSQQQQMPPQQFQQQPQQGAAPWNGQPPQGQPQGQPQQPFQQQQPPQGQYQPQAQPPQNPGMQFQPAGQPQQQPPAGWPQQ